MSAGSERRELVSEFGGCLSADFSGCWSWVIFESSALSVCGSAFTEEHILATEKHCILYENSSAVGMRVICL